ncbi:MAG: hypothetical protein KC620_22265 [Myxococcales bacterium]|nr:hypothetical protein [Myxococcales bacterium]
MSRHLRMPFAAALATAALLSAPRPAAAEISPADLTRPADSDELGPGYGRNEIQFHLDVGLYLGSAEDGVGYSEDRTVISPMLRIFQPVDFNEVEFAWGLSYLSVSGDAGDNSSFQFGNPFVAWYWAWRTLPQQFRLGLGVTGPLAQLRDEEPGETAIDLQALTLASYMRARREPWLWWPEGLSGIGHVDYYRRYAFGLVVGGQAMAAAMYSLDDSPFADVLGHAGLNFAAEVDLDVAYDTRYVRSMLRASYVTMPLLESDAEGVEFSYDDKDQIGVEVEIRVRLGGADVLARFDVPIDEPGGFAFDDGKVYGAFIGVSSPTDLRLPDP